MRDGEEGQERAATQRKKMPFARGKERKARARLITVRRLWCRPRRECRGPSRRRSSSGCSRRKPPGRSCPARWCRGCGYSVSLPFSQRYIARAPRGLPRPPSISCGKSGRRCSMSGGGNHFGHSCLLWTSATPFQEKPSRPTPMPYCSARPLPSIKIEMPRGGIDDDRARLLAAREIDLLARLLAGSGRSSSGGGL